MTSPPRPVSLCTVTGNRAALLPLLEDCVLAQDFPLEQMEWVVLDDSPGPLPPLFARARRAGLAVRHIPVERLPLGAKRNRAHALCRGRFVVLLDDDDYYPPSRVRHAVERPPGSGCPVAGSSQLPILLLPERSLWLAGPYGDGHATANTLAFRRSFLDDHRCDPAATAAEEAALLENFQAPMVQLDPLRTVFCIGHGGNTVDKRSFIAEQRGGPVAPLGLPLTRLVPAAWLARYEAALAGATVPGTACASAADPAAAEEPPPFRVAVITPYHQEDPAVLRRCHESVLAQTLPCTHFLVADGGGDEEVDGFAARHIRLGAGHADNGNTPRTVGALCAMNEGFDAIAFLDADNWFHPDHLQSALDTRERERAEVVFSDRELVFPDGTVLLEPDGEDRERSHVDTSCIVVFAPAFHSLALWAQMPAELGPNCDRVCFQHLRARCRCAWSERASVAFETWYLGHFVAAGRVPPASAKFLARRPAAEWEVVRERFRERSPTPVAVEPLPVSGPRAQLSVVTILAPPGSGGTGLQRKLAGTLGCFGLPGHNLLHVWAQAFGGDGQRRRGGDEIRQALERLAAEAQERQQGRWQDMGGVAIAPLLDPERSFSLLEAYFRVVQRSTPARAMAFSRRFGPITVVDRSPSLALHADLLYAALPEHRAVLLLREPLAQLAVMRRRGAAGLPGWRQGPLTTAEHCAQILETWLQPLRAAPAGQLLVLAGEAVALAEAEALARIWRFLEKPLADPPRPLEWRPPPGGVINPVYALQEEALARLSLAEISAGSPWRAAEAQAQMEAQAAWQAAAPPLPAQEQADVRALFAPLGPLLAGHGGDAGGAAVLLGVLLHALITGHGLQASDARWSRSTWRRSGPLRRGIQASCTHRRGSSRQPAAASRWASSAGSGWG